MEGPSFDMYPPEAGGSPTPPGMQSAPRDPSTDISSDSAPMPQQALLAAVEAHYVAVRAKAISNLNNYMVTPVGVGEHPDIVAEAIKLMEDINHADGMLQTLRRITSQ